MQLLCGASSNKNNQRTQTHERVQQHPRELALRRQLSTHTHQRQLAAAAAATPHPHQQCNPADKATRLVCLALQATKANTRQPTAAPKASSIRPQSEVRSGPRPQSKSVPGTHTAYFRLHAACCKDAGAAAAGVASNVVTARPCLLDAGLL
jgi:hypothetical protein